MGRNFFAITLTLFIAALSASAQTPETASQANSGTAIEKVVYKRSAYSPGIFSSKWEEPNEVTYLLQTNAMGHQLYRLNGVFFFDPHSFSTTYMIVKADYVFQPTTTRQDNTFVVGATWKSGYTVPPREGSRCKGDTTNEFQSTVKEVKPMPVMLDGKETVVEVAVVAQEGTWNVPDCGSGRGSALIVYAIDKKVIISIESLAYYGTGIVSGSRLQPVDIIQRKTP